VRQDHGAAVTQVDVVGHSMGGLVARARIKYDGWFYSAPSNLGKGDIHKIVTIGTPHQGTPFGDLLAQNQCRTLTPFGPTLATVLSTFGFPIGPAIFGFQTTSEPIANIGETPVPAHAVVGVAPVISGWEALLNELLNDFDLNTFVDALLGGEGNHDVIVPLASQRGGLSGLLTTTFFGLTHLDETHSPDIADQVIYLLGRPAPGPVFGTFSAWPAGAGYIQPYTCPAIASSGAPAAGRLVLTPAAGEVYRPGDEVLVTGEVVNGAPVEGWLVSFGGEPDAIEGPGPWTRTFTASATTAGRVNIAAFTYGGTENYAATTHIFVVPAGSPLRLTAAPSPLSLAVLGETAQVRVTGHYDGGGVYDLTSGGAGTTYSIDDPTVATVTSDGQVEARGNGATTIVVTHGGRSASVDVDVSMTNAAPVLSPFTPVSIGPGQSADVPVVASDPDGDPLRITGANLPPWATVADLGGGTGVVRLRPTADAVGTYSLLVSVTDDGTPSLGDTQALRVTVGSGGGSQFRTVTPCRAVDTRAAEGPALAAGTTRTFTLVECGIPPGARSVSLNVTATQPSNAGHLRLFAGGGDIPPTSSLNFSAGQTRGNNAIVPLGAAADLSVFAGQAGGSVHVIIDVNGYFQ
jgi:hypothetical protein